MSRFKHWALAAGLVTVAVLALPQDGTAQRSDVEIWSANCGRCHVIQPPGRYSAKDWSSLVVHMSITARLTGAEEAAVRRFLVAGARAVTASADAAPEPVPVLPASRTVDFTALQVGPELEEVYKQQCEACHGSSGKGDGPAAVAFNPKPADFNSVEFWAERTDEQIVEAITDGFGVMPPVAAVTPEVSEAMAKYLRERFVKASAKKTER